MGGSAPVESQPRGLPVAASCPRCACAARSAGGEVFTSSAYPYCARFVTGTGGFRFAGRSGNCCPIDGLFGSMIAPTDPDELNSPAYGAPMPPNDSHGDPLCRFCSDCVAAASVTGVGLLPPSI